MPPGIFGDVFASVWFIDPDDDNVPLALQVVAPRVTATDPVNPDVDDMRSSSNHPDIDIPSNHSEMESSGSKIPIGFAIFSPDYYAAFSSSASTSCTVHAADVPPLTLTPMPRPATVESKPPEVVCTFLMSEEIPVVGWLVSEHRPCRTAEVPLPTARNTTTTSKQPLSTAAVPALNVKLLREVSAVLPAVPTLT